MRHRNKKGRVIIRVTPDQTESPLLAVLGHLPQWLLMLTGFGYATGFLILNNFFNRFGLKETASDFFKIKYIHIGITFLIFGGLFVIPVMAVLRRMRSESETSQLRTVVSIPAAFLFANQLLVVYAAILFAPRDFTKGQGGQFPLGVSKNAALLMILAGTILGLLFDTSLSQKLLKAEFTYRFKVVSQWWLMALVVCADWLFLAGIFRRLAMILSYAQYFIYLVVLICLTISLTFTRIPKITSKPRRVIAGILALDLLAALYYMAVLAFSVGVYPFISAQRGGGDYSDASRVVIRFSPEIKESVPQNLLDSTGQSVFQSKRLIMIEETGTSYLVADPDDSGGPSNWTRGIRPNVFEIGRERVVGLTYINHLD